MKASQKIYKIKESLHKFLLFQKKSLKDIIFEVLKTQLHPSKTLLFFARHMLQKITCGKSIAFFS